MKTSLSPLVVALLGLLHLVQLMPVADVQAKVDENFVKEAMTDGFIVQNPFASTTPQRETESMTLDLQDGQRADMSEASGGDLEGSGDYTASAADPSGPRLHLTTAANTTSPFPGQEEGSGEASGHFGDDLVIEEMATTTTTATTASVSAASTTEILSTTEFPSTAEILSSSTTQVPSTTQGLSSSSTTQSPSSTTATGAKDVNALGVAPETDSPLQSTTTTTTSTVTSTVTSTTTDPILLPPSAVVDKSSFEKLGTAASSSGWMIIVGFVVGVAAMVLICIAVATKDKWNGPTPATVQAQSNGGSREQEQQQKQQQHEEQEMEEFLPTEERGGAEYTVVPLSELCEKEPLS